MATTTAATGTTASANLKHLEAWMQSDIGDYEPEASPEYSKEPRQGETTVKVPTELESNHETVEEKTIEVVYYMVNSRAAGKTDDKWTSCGSLQIGRVKHFGQMENAVWYKPSGSDAIESDISSDVIVVHDTDPSDETIHYLKKPNAKTANWGFDIRVKLPGTDSSSFTGTISAGNLTEDVEGSAVCVKPKKAKSHDFAEPVPADSKGTPTGLRGLSPYSTIQTEAVKFRQDLAQVYGQKLMQRLMFYAMNEKTRKTLLPSMAELSAEERRVLDDHRDFFHRMGTHNLADHIKEMPEIDSKIRDGIKPQFTNFLDMLSASDPSENQGGKEDVKSDAKGDPVAAYGWNWKDDGEKIRSLRNHFTSASMRSYELGYIQACPAWKDYTSHAAYWFRYLSSYLLSEPFLAKWRLNSTDRVDVPGAMSVTEEVNFWTNKLSLLKHAASDKEALELDLTKVTTRLEAEANEAAAFTRKLNSQLAKELSTIYSEMELESKTQETKKRFHHISEEAKEIHMINVTEAQQMIHHLTDPHSYLSTKMNDYINRRIPDIAIRVNEPNVGQAAHALGDGVLLDALEEAEELPLFQRLKNKMKNVMQGISWKNAMVGLVKGVLRAAGIMALINSLSAVYTGQKMPKLQLYMIISMTTAESIRFFSWGFSKLLNRPFVQNQIRQRLNGWISLAVRKVKDWAIIAGNWFVKHAEKMIRIVGIIGCFLNVAGSYDELFNNSEEVDPMSQTAFRWYHGIQLTLGIVECILLSVDLVAFLGSMETLAAFAGPAAFFVGLASLAVTLVYMRWFAPDPHGDVKEFLRGEGREMKSYNGE
ncbi:uncharacterized protein N7503_006418 [Penicillium pulvis]|uniref:uncharacterized protein n=1 Tax=Penicillium pulvis TaxID=1562058 RepID=UPI0025497183|nr:uncharacterized protein N7503_006418 [Penicillium pulvis]KAJ5798913.1 hypothetical protein N7503_006418 [Penicillium pulvis]